MPVTKVPKSGDKPTTTTKPGNGNTSTNPRDAGAKKNEKGDWIWPTGQTNLSGYHYTDTHHAVDIGTRSGDKIWAPTGGEIVDVGYDEDGYGIYVVQRAETGEKIIFGHLSSANVAVGQIVQPGAVVGAAGSTGNSTGPHLHYEVRTPGGGGWIDPYTLTGDGTVDPYYVSESNYTGPGDKIPTPANSASTGSTGSTGSNKGPTARIPIPGTGSALTISPFAPIMDWVATIKWGNVFSVVAGVGVVGVGIYGLVSQEGAKVIGGMIGNAIKGGTE